MKGMRFAIAAAFSICLSAGGSVGQATAADGDKAAAEAFIAPYIGKPSAFPVTTPLAKSAKGKKIAFMDCGTPICALFVQLMTPAAEMTGIEVTRLQTGFSADKIADAFDNVLASNFDGVFIGALPGPLWSRALDKLNERKIPVITSGVVDVDPAKLGMSGSGAISVTQAAKLLAAYVVVHGDPSDVVFYVTPELGFSTIMFPAFKDKLAEYCPDCSVREATIPVASFGTTSPSVIVNDLQAHPSTKSAIFPVGEQALGLPSAMKVAGIQVDTYCGGPDPQALKQIQDGEMKACLGLDLPILVWTEIDTLARLMTGQQAEPAAVKDEVVVQFLTAAELPGDVSRGWTGYPDFADRFKAIWASGE